LQVELSNSNSTVIRNVARVGGHALDLVDGFVNAPKTAELVRRTVVRRTADEEFIFADAVLKAADSHRRPIEWSETPFSVVHEQFLNRVGKFTPSNNDGDRTDLVAVVKSFRYSTDNNGTVERLINPSGVPGDEQHIPIDSYTAEGVKFVMERMLKTAVGV
jgi:hypothetical protein